MEGPGGTASLRKAAPHWNLAGDKQLLDLLQNLHETIVTKCQEANSNLEEMVNTLDTASISLQNVNNRLMALSNSQFVESRVYEDDTDVATVSPPAKVKEPTKPSDPTSELSKLRDSLRVLEAYHEPVHVVDSDSESSSDEEDERMVFKPKDLYADRPLPYIIGSQQWRNKWHAGLVVEDSDTESDTSKANPPSEQYSDSEPERDDADTQTDKPHASQRTISTTSSTGSELTVPTVGKPADIAAELARRLGGNVPHIPEPVSEPEAPPNKSVPTKVYRPEQPATATIFSDEPPPLDTYQSDQSDSECDVFAELHRSTASREREGVASASAVADQLFGNVSNVYGRKSGFVNDGESVRQSNPDAKQSSPLFEEAPDSELLATRSVREQQSVHTEPQQETLIKKPIGGISIFGNNQGAESIGAAILKRNQRNVSPSDEEIEEPIPNQLENKAIKAEAGCTNKEKISKDIINDLFLKSNKTRQSTKSSEERLEGNIEISTNKKVDLFNDNLFDDIDDIFTNVKPVVTDTQESVKKSLFDDDDDELFADIAISSKKTTSNAKPNVIFDDDDDLFSGQEPKNIRANLNDDCNSNKDLLEKSNSVSNIIKYELKSDQEVTEKMTESKKNEENIISINNVNTIVKEVNNGPMQGRKFKGLFDSDSDDDIFSEFKSPKSELSHTQISKSNKQHNVNEKTDTQSKDDKYDLDFSKDISSFKNIDIGRSVQNNEIDINKKKDELLQNDSIFTEIEKPQSFGNEFSSSQIKNIVTNNVGDINKFDNSKKTDDVLTAHIKSGSKFENKTITEDDLRPSTSSNDSKMQNKELSNKLRNINIPKIPFRSPSLFDEDDDLDNIFTTSPDSDKYKEIDVICNDTKNQHSTQSHKADVYDVSNEHNSLTDNFNVSEIVKSEITGISTLKNVNPEVSKDMSKVIRQEGAANLIINYLQESDKPNVNSSISNMPKRKESLANFQEREQLFFGNNEPVSSDPDTFSDIFTDIPPEFERPKEPKKSKNVNALFDDDSDDEALFFKKNEIMSDDKPVTFNSQDDRLFHIFHDEPPAIDVDFSQKPKQVLSSELEIPSGDTISELHTSKTDKFERTNVTSLFGEDTPKLSNTVIDPVTADIVEDAKKPVGKLKPVSFNINVTTLLPGASPKKSKPSEQVDGAVLSTKNIQDNIRSEESKMIKSVSFENDPESEILDNKLSKERAKIQVKRRPSSRRARKEAVRKSGIDFGDDSTDNSSSTDISKNDNCTKKSDNLEVNDNTIPITEYANATKEEDIVVITQESITNMLDDNNASKLDVSTEPQKFNIDQDFLSNTKRDIPEYVKESVNLPIETEIIENKNVSTTSSKRPDIKSKVVYILNDEDIFTDAKLVTTTTENNFKQSKTNPNVAITQNLNDLDDDDELFKPSDKQKINVATIGNIYTNTNSNKNEIDNFDSDEDIFKASNSQPGKVIVPNTKSSGDKDEIDKLEAKIDKLFVKTQTTTVKSSLFDDLSDDESELFGSKKCLRLQNTSDAGDGIRALVKKEVKLPNTDLKGSLFGNDSDDNDLFAVRSTSKVTSQTLSKPKQISSKPVEPVFEDPLSVLVQDDDM